MKVMNHGGVRLALSSNPPFKYDAQVNADETDTPAWVLFLFEGQPVRPFQVITCTGGQRAAACVECGHASTKACAVLNPLPLPVFHPAGPPGHLTTTKFVVDSGGPPPPPLSERPASPRPTVGRTVHYFQAVDLMLDKAEPPREEEWSIAPTDDPDRHVLTVTKIYRVTQVQPHAAVITAVYGDDRACLHVFPGRHNASAMELMWVAFSEKPEPGCWTWPPRAS